MKHVILAALLFGIAPVAPAAASPTVEVANGDWSRLPPLKQRSTFNLKGVPMSRIHEIASDGECPSLVVRRGVLNFETTFAAHFNADGTVNKVILRRLNCPEVEGILGGVVLEMIQKGDYVADGSNLDNWYQGSLGFTVQ